MGDPATFRGFSNSPGRTVTDTGLYEFYTEQNVLIQIHDSHCSKITFHPDQARLEMTFIIEDPRYTPKGLARDGRVNLLFDQVAILRWDGDQTGHDPEDVPGGLVSDLIVGRPHFFRIDLLSRSPCPRTASLGLDQSISIIRHPSTALHETATRGRWIAHGQMPTVVGQPSRWAST